MRRNEGAESRLARPALVAVLVVGGVAWLSFKAEYLRMDVLPGVKALLFSPGVLLLAAAAFVAFPDRRRRLAGALVVAGAAALLWVLRAEIPHLH